MAARSKPTVEYALQHHRAGRLAEAETVARTVLAQRPANADALNLLGMIAGQRGRIEDAAEFFRRALAAAPQNAIFLSNLAETLRLRRRTAEAVPLLRQSVALAPAFANGHYKLAVALMELGQTDEALTACRAGLMYHPKDANLNCLAARLLSERHPVEAAPYLGTALEQAPESDRHWEQLGRLLSVVPVPLTTGVRAQLQKALAHPVIQPGDIAECIAQSLCRDRPIADLLALSAQADLPRGQALAEGLMQLGSDTLLVTLMETVAIPSPPLEQLFTGLRRALLLEVDTHDLAPTVLPFCAALAIQSFITDYVWSSTDEEAAAVDRLINRLTTHLSHPMAAEFMPPEIMVGLAVAGAYRPLYALEQAARIAQLSWPEPFGNLLRIQITEPLQERELQADIPRLTPVTDGVSQQVRAQYEENPYPRWVRAGRAPAALPLPVFLNNLGATLPQDPSFATPDVLIAGCGTGQHAIFAASFFQAARILAIDLSLTSLAYAVRNSRQLGLDTIEYCQGDILELGGLVRQFHVIESVGVLHHLADPMQGLGVLVDRLHPGGLLHLGLYSEIARRIVVMAREQIAQLGYAATADNIRRYRRYILDLPDDQPLAALRRMRDLFNTSECRDLLFHVQEHRFTLPRIKEALEHFGLRFLGFRILPNAAVYRQRFPDDPRMTSLDNWHEFEQAYPDTFINMYNFWVQKV